MPLRSEQTGLDSTRQVIPLVVRLYWRREHESSFAGICLNQAKLCVAAGVEVNKPTHFTVYTKGAGKARPEVRFSTAGKATVVRDFEIIDNHNYSYTVRYTAVQQVRRSPGSAAQCTGDANRC